MSSDQFWWTRECHQCLYIVAQVSHPHGWNNLQLSNRSLKNTANDLHPVQWKLIKYCGPDLRWRANLPRRHLSTRLLPVTWNRGYGSNSPLLMHGDQIPQPLRNPWKTLIIKSLPLELAKVSNAREIEASVPSCYVHGAATTHRPWDEGMGFTLDEVFFGPRGPWFAWTCSVK